jgi:hypothetical protein
MSVLHLSGLPNNVDPCRELTREELWVLRMWGVPCDRPVFDPDLKAAGIANNLPHRRRLEKLGLSKGRWHGGRRSIYPVELAHYLLRLPEELPYLMAKRSAKGLAQARQVNEAKAVTEATSERG